MKDRMLFLAMVGGAALLGVIIWWSTLRDKPVEPIPEGEPETPVAEGKPEDPTVPADSSHPRPNRAELKKTPKTPKPVDHKPGLEAARKRVKEKLERKGLDLEETMRVFSPRSKGGWGIGPEPEAMALDSIEQMFLMLEKVKAPPVEENVASLREAAYAAAAVAELIQDRMPFPSEAKSLAPRLWKEQSQRTQRFSLELAAALERRRASDIQISARNLNKACASCHDMFRGGHAWLALRTEGLKSTDEKVRERTAEKLRGFCGYSSLSNVLSAELKKWLQDQDAFVRNTAAGCCGALGPQAKEMTPRLLEMLSDQDAKVRRASVAALQRIEPRHDTAIYALNLGLEKADDYTRGWFAHYLGRLGERADAKEVVPLLAEALKHPDAPIRVKSAELMGRIATRQVVPLLEAAQKDPEAEVRQAATAALAQINPKAAFPELVRNLQDVDAVVRGEAAIALARRGKQAVPDLIGVLKTGSREARGSALFALGKIGADARAAVPQLVELVGGDDAYLRKLAGNALRKIDPEAADKAGVK